MLTNIQRPAAVAAAAVLVLGAAGCSSAAPEEGPGSAGGTLRFAMNSPEANPIYGAASTLASSLEEATEGRWKIEIFANEILGTQQETLDLVEDGSLDFAIVSGPVLVDLNPDFGVFDLPAIFDSIDHQMKVINNDEITAPLYTSLEDRNIAVIGAFTQGERSVYTTKGPVTEPKDLNGVKLRVQQSDLFVDMLAAMGATPTPMSFGEVYTALQSGVVDGAENNEVSYAANKHFEVASYYSYTKHVISVDYVVASVSMLEGMSEQDRAAVDAAFESAVQEHLTLWAQRTAEAIAEAEAGGATFFKDVDAAKFQEALAPVRDKYASGSEVIKSIVDSARRLSTG